MLKNPLWGIKSPKTYQKYTGMLQVKLWIKGGRVLSLEEMGFVAIKPHSLLSSHPIVRESQYREGIAGVYIESIPVVPMKVSTGCLCVRHGVFRHNTQADLFLVITNQYPTLVRIEKGHLVIILNYRSMEGILGKGPKIDQPIWETFLSQYVGLIRAYRSDLKTPIQYRHQNN